jgi:hypothetical protein
VLVALLLSAIVAWASLSLAVRLKLDGRAETVVATTVLASGIVLLPVYAMGATGTLTRAALAIAALGLALGVTVASTVGVGLRAQTRATAGALRGIVSMPAEGLALAWRTRSAVLPCIALCLLILLYNLVAAWLAPSWRQWDALWYHEPIIGFTIQDHGFAPVDLPPGGMQKVNGYPRASEMLSLWFAMFAGRRLIDLPNVLLLPALFASVYALTRRLTGDRLTSAGWASVACTVPANVELLQTVYVDPALATFVACGALFVLRSPPRAREGLLGAGALAIAANVKVSGVFPVAALALVAVALQLGAPGAKARRGRAAMTLVAGAAMIIGMSAVTYLGNLHKYGNPVWPDFHVRLPSLGIDWPGNGDWGGVTPEGQHHGVSKNVPLWQLLQELFTPPGRIKDDEQRHIHTYGLGVPWVLLPAALLVALRLASGALRWRSSDARTRNRWLVAVLLTLTVAVTLVTSTNRSTPRYHVPSIALWVPVVAWALQRRRALQEALVYAVTVGALAVMAWEVPSWRSFPGPSALVTLLRMDPPLREMTPELGGTVRRAAGLARESELTAGTTVVSDDFIFPAILWNNDYSNRVVYRRATTDVASAADRLQATWVYAQDASLAQRLRGSGSWEEIGPLFADGNGIAFRRATR